MDPSSILRELQSLDNGRTASKPAAREEMLRIAQKLVASLQQPSELIAIMTWQEPAKAACARAALDLKIFETLTEHGDQGASIVDLAKPTGADVSLISRIMKHLSATWVVAEAGLDRYRHTSTSAQLVESKFSDGILAMYDMSGPPLRGLPAYFAHTSWKDPRNSGDGPFQFAHNTKSHMFPWLADNPPYLQAFGNYMAGYRDGKTPWFSPDFFPVQSQLVNAHSNADSETILVDVGGGQGHDLLALVSAFPDLEGHVVLQDQPEVLGVIDPPLPSSITATAHDFFTPQPVKNARAYFMHSIMHDWDDENCIKILKALKSALKPGYSKILIHELIIADEGASWYATSMDLLMCAALAARERTESDFKRLLEAAGLQLDKIWMYEPGTEAIIEASLPA